MKFAAAAIGLATIMSWALMPLRGPHDSTAGFWFEPVSYDSRVLGGSLGPADVDAIARIAHEELANAFQPFGVTITDRRDARYRVRVVQELVLATMHRKTWVAGHSYASAFGAAGEVSFRYFAQGALAYAPPDLPRPELIAAIGRGIGRGAAHEFAHVMGYTAHDSRDRGSYEYHAASREQQYFGPMHWDVAAPVLEKRLGRQADPQKVRR